MKSLPLTWPSPCTPSAKYPPGGPAPMRRCCWRCTPRTALAANPRSPADCIFTLNPTRPRVAQPREVRSCGHAFSASRFSWDGGASRDGRVAWVRARTCARPALLERLLRSLTHGQVWFECELRSRRGSPAREIRREGRDHGDATGARPGAQGQEGPRDQGGYARDNRVSQGPVGVLRREHPGGEERCAITPPGVEPSSRVLVVNSF